MHDVQYKSNKSLSSVLKLQSFCGANRSFHNRCYCLTPILETVGHPFPNLFFFFYVKCQQLQSTGFLSKVYIEMVLSSCKKQFILFFYAKGCKVLTIVKILCDERLLYSRVGVAKFIKKFEEMSIITRCISSGRPSKVTAEVRQIVEDQMRLDEKTTAVHSADRNKDKRLAWAREHLHDTFDDVIWTDECTAQMASNHRFCCRKRGEVPKSKPRYSYV